MKQRLSCRGIRVRIRNGVRTMKKLGLYLSVIMLLSGCMKGIDCLDPDSMVYFSSSPNVLSTYAASIEYGLKVNRNAVLYYVSVPAGSVSPTAEDILDGKASGGTTPSSSGKLFVTGNSLSAGVVLPDTNTTYDIYITAMSREGMSVMATIPYKISGTTVSTYSFRMKLNFSGAYGVASDPEGNMYAVSMDYSYFYKFSQSGELLNQVGGYGAGDGLFSDPQCIACDREGNVYVTDRYNYRVQKFDTDGNFVMKFGASGSGNGQFQDCLGIAVAPDGSIYVSDGNLHRVQKFDAQGNYLLQWGSGPGSAVTQFNQPNAVAVDPAGYVYVADYFNDRVQKFDSNGNYVMTIGSSGYGDGEFIDLVSVCVDNAFRVYVCDAGNSRVQKLTTNGVYLAQWGTYGAGDGEYNAMHQITVDGSGNVWVADSGNAKIEKFR